MDSCATHVDADTLATQLFRDPPQHGRAAAPEFDGTLRSGKPLRIEDILKKTDDARFDHGQP